MDSHTTIKKTAFYPQSREEVWEAITNQEALSTWFMKTDFKPEVGFPYRMSWKTGSVGGEIKEVKKPEKLSYTWIVQESDVETLVEWFLQEKDGGTEVTLTHSGFEKFGGDRQEKEFTLHTSGWEHQLTKALPTYLSKK